MNWNYSPGILLHIRDLIEWMWFSHHVDCHLHTHLFETARCFICIVLKAAFLHLFVIICEQHHTKPATSIFLKRFPYRERFFVASLIINLLSSQVCIPVSTLKDTFHTLSFHSEVDWTFFQTLISAAILDTLPWEHCIKIEPNFLLDLHQAVRQRWWMTEGVKGQTDLLHLRFQNVSKVHVNWVHKSSERRC